MPEPNLPRLQKKGDQYFVNNGDLKMQEEKKLKSKYISRFAFLKAFDTIIKAMIGGFSFALALRISPVLESIFSGLYDPTTGSAITSILYFVFTFGLTIIDLFVAKYLSVIKINAKEHDVFLES